MLKALCVKQSSEEVFRRLTTEVAQLPKHNVATGGPQTLVVTRHQIPGWAVLVAVLLFPIGLLALTARKEVTTAIVARPLDDGRTELTISGHASVSLQRALERVTDLPPPPVSYIENPGETG